MVIYIWNKKVIRRKNFPIHLLRVYTLKKYSEPRDGRSGVRVRLSDHDGLLSPVLVRDRQLCPTVVVVVRSAYQTAGIRPPPPLATPHHPQQDPSACVSIPLYTV
ncbi:hypothetical protein J6590_008113 [Homalodisca vitripennis]|nr:hypothetical protein J6590_008113 [Homalodisca vitripennis]